MTDKGNQVMEMTEKKAAKLAFAGALYLDLATGDETWAARIDLTDLDVGTCHPVQLCGGWDSFKGSSLGDISPAARVALGFNSPSGESFFKFGYTSSLSWNQFLTVAWRKEIKKRIKRMQST